MKVIHVCYSDLNGGAAKAAYRIYLAQRKIGIESYMYVIDKKSDDEYVLSPSNTRRIWVKILGKIARIILKFQKTDNLVIHSLNIFPSGIANKINKLKPDVINLHWINNEMLSIAEIRHLKGKVVWTLHDMWPFCGAEHYDDPMCQGRYIEGYKNNNKPNGNEWLDIDRLVFNFKLKKLSNLDINFVAPSHWIAGCLKNSFLFHNRTVNVIGNCLNFNVYKPIDEYQARRDLNLPLDKKLVLFGAMASTKDSRKGFHVLVEIINKAKEDFELNNSVEFVIFGAESDKYLEMQMPCHFMGSVTNEQLLAKIYSACDIFLAPSRQDNLPNTINESLACGTPCVAFDVGGIPDLITSAELGYLAKDNHINDFYNKMKSILNQKHTVHQRELIHLIAKNVRDEKKVARDYKVVYENKH